MARALVKRRKQLLRATVEALVPQAAYALQMPSTVADVFAGAGLVPEGVMRWGVPIPQQAPGIYVVALTDERTRCLECWPEPPLNADCLSELLGARPRLRLDGAKPTVGQLAGRLGAFWLADEIVLYIGLAGRSLRTRVRQYYSTPLGAKRPHAGGWWLKTLSVLDDLWVHYVATPQYQSAESDMLNAFADGASPRARAALYDPLEVAPFANLRTGSGAIKAHGITGATGNLPARQSGASRMSATTPPESARAE